MKTRTRTLFCHYNVFISGSEPLRQILIFDFNCLSPSFQFGRLKTKGLRETGARVEMEGFPLLERPKTSLTPLEPQRAGLLRSLGVSEDRIADNPEMRVLVNRLFSWMQNANVKRAEAASSGREDKTLPLSPAPVNSSIPVPPDMPSTSAGLQGPAFHQKPILKKRPAPPVSAARERLNRDITYALNQRFEVMQPDARSDGAGKTENIYSDVAPSEWSE